MTTIEIAVQRRTSMNDNPYEPSWADTDSWPVAPRRNWFLLIGQNIGSVAVGIIADLIMVALSGSIPYALPIGVIAAFLSLWIFHEIDRHGKSLPSA